MWGTNNVRASMLQKKKKKKTNKLERNRNATQRGRFFHATI